MTGFQFPNPNDILVFGITYKDFVTNFVFPLGVALIIFCITWRKRKPIHNFALRQISKLGGLLGKLFPYRIVKKTKDEDYKYDYIVLFIQAQRYGPYEIGIAPSDTDIDDTDKFLGPGIRFVNFEAAKRHVIRTLGGRDNFESGPINKISISSNLVRHIRTKEEIEFVSTE